MSETVQNTGISKDLGLIQDSESAEQISIDQYYLFVIAIDNYGDADVDNPPPTLNNPVLDASRITELLLSKYNFYRPELVDRIFLAATSDKYRGEEYRNQAIEYKGVQTKCLYNENATYEKIEDHLGVLSECMGENDALLVYFSGHGVSKNDKFFFQPFGADRLKSKTWFDISWLTSFFDNFTKNNTCRDLLLILDCCFAGTAGLGMQGIESEKFSRYVLTATGHDQKAFDGPRGEGSPFAEVLIGQLMDNTSESYSLNADNLNKDFQLQHAGASPQEIRYLPLPMKENGLGSFVFELKIKDRLPIKPLCDSFIEFLDFEEQKRDLMLYYDKNAPLLKIITTFGSSENTLRILNKICFQWLFNKRRITLSKKGYNYWEVNLTKVEGSDKIWDPLFKHSEISSEIFEEAKVKFVNWILNRLVGDPDSQEPVHEIIQMIFEIGDSVFLKNLELFCTEFRDIYFEIIDQLEVNKKNNLGKLFLVISDRRTEAMIHFSAKDKDEFVALFGQKINFIPTRKITNITYNHISHWLGKFQDAHDLKIVQKMTVEQFVPDENSLEYDIEDFIDKVISHCDLDPVDVIDQLHDFGKQSF